MVKPEDEAKLSSEYLLAHAEVVRTYQQAGPCPDVQDEVRILRYFVQLGPETRQERNVGALVQSVTNIESIQIFSDTNIFLCYIFKFNILIFVTLCPGQPGSYCGAQLFVEQRELAPSQAED